jgi:uncharacterized surface protein with fasciclin (FAS1) repeats
MHLSVLRRSAGLLAGAVTLALVGAMAPAPAPASTATSAAAAQARLGTRSLAAVLAQDGVGRLDGRWGDYDIAEKAIYAVLEAKPDSPLAAVANGRIGLTVFVPTDAGFRRFVLDVTGRLPRTEAATFNRVAQIADVDTLEAVLLYHVTKRLNSGQVVRASKGGGTGFVTAQGRALKIVARHGTIRIADKDPQIQDPRVIISKTDVNKGNRQLAHGISRVLLPVNL